MLKKTNLLYFNHKKGKIAGNYVINCTEKHLIWLNKNKTKSLLSKTSNI